MHTATTPPARARGHHAMAAVFSRLAPRLRDRFAGVCWLALGALLWPAVARAETVAPSPDWRHTISVPEDAFRAQGTSREDPGWIKFTVFRSDLTRVYFQDSNQHPFHYDFATRFVSEYKNYTRWQYDEATLHPATQVAVLGAVILPHWTPGTPPASQIREYGLQFVAQEPYDPVFLVTLFNLVRAGIHAEPGTQAFYFPSFEQQASAEHNRAYFESQGISISSTARWATGNALYAPGWALGVLKFITASEITPAFLTGQLLPADILLTDGVPAEVPMVAGIVSLVPATPNSHVAILSKTFGIPFVHLAIPDDAARAQQLAGRRIVLRAFGHARGGPDIRLLETEGLTQQQHDELLALRQPPPLEILPVTPFGAFSAPAQGLNPPDTRYFGGKAAHFGMIRRSIPDHSPVAAAFSFDLWTAFMDQMMPGGQTLREKIRTRLAPHRYPPDIAALASDLQAIRDLIENHTSFSPALQAAVFATLQDPQYGFDPGRKIRFRSSTNVEDTEEFSGAGMYDSFSGCLADDLDADTGGPSLCDPGDPKEHGVFRAIRKVYASFYNQNAFLERIRRNVNEDEVGMGLLVHHSYPDEIELANGVATFERQSSFSTQVMLVTQKGAVSVTNPPLGSIPEQVDAFVYNGVAYPSVTTYSNLVPLGGTVLTWSSEYTELISLLKSVADTFAATTGKSRYVLDFEYKKVAPSGRLEIKQVRELAIPDSTPNIVPFLLDEPVEYCTFQGEYADVFANHRLKIRWSLQTRNMWLTPQELQASVLSGDSLAYVQDGDIRTLSGAPADWPGFAYSFLGNVATDRWQVPGAENPSTLAARIHNIGAKVSSAQSPVLVLSDLGYGYLELQADYAKPVPIVELWNGQTTTRQETVRLQPCPRPSPDDLPQERSFSAKGVTVTTRFYWPLPSGGVAAGYTAPLVRWEQTTIAGLTSEPIVLHSYFSQTYRPDHHNFGEHFLFEPELEEDLPAALRDELRSRNIRLIYAHIGFQDPEIEFFGFPVPGDFDRNGHVDLEDSAHLVDCAAGPSVPYEDFACADADLDRDGDVDQTDFGLFQRCFSGPKAPADIACLAHPS